MYREITVHLKQGSQIRGDNKYINILQNLTKNPKSKQRFSIDRFLINFIAFLISTMKYFRITSYRNQLPLPVIRFIPLIRSIEIFILKI